jgi:hypothetical protein
MEGFVNSPEAVAALEAYKAFYECCTPPGHSDAYMTENLDAYKSGQVAMQMNFFAFFPGIAKDENVGGDKSGFFVNRLMPQMHQYHLDDAPNLRSCNLLLKPQPGNSPPGPSAAIDEAEIERFYGRTGSLRVRYVKEKLRLDYGKAHEDEYELEYLESTKERFFGRATGSSL